MRGGHTETSVAAVINVSLMKTTSPPRFDCSDPSQLRETTEGIHGIKPTASVLWFGVMAFVLVINRSRILLLAVSAWASAP
jgi:hypothetical protein